MRWFDSLEEGSIHSYEKLTRAFGARFVTCCRVPRPLDSLLSMSMREGETLKNYSNRYQEIYNEFDGDFEDVVVRTFKVGLLTHSNLWKSLTMKPPQGMHQLMDQIEEHKRVEDNKGSSKGKAKAFIPDRNDSSIGKFVSSQPRKEFYNQTSHTVVGSQAVNSVFKEMIYQVLEKIKHEPYFKWPNKMGGDPTKRNQNLYCQYRQDHQGHTIEECRTLQAFLDQLIKANKLKQFLQQPNSQANRLMT